MSTYATRDDEHVMRILSGATFGPNARVTLPSGKVMSSDEMTWNAEADLAAQAEGVRLALSKLDAIIRQHKGE